MKTARRHELQTNELSQQLDELVAYSQKYGWQIFAGVVAVLVVAVAIYLYTSSRRSNVEKAWAELAQPQAIIAATTPEQIAYFRSIAERNVSPMLSALALFQAGNLALGEATSPRTSDPQRADWLRQAEQFLEQVLQGYGQHVVPASNARLSLGIVAENRGDAATARAIYQQILDDAGLKDMPAQIQARYRIGHLQDWATPVVFPPPPAPTTAPTTSTAEAAATQPLELNPFQKRPPSQPGRLTLPAAPPVTSGPAVP